MGPHEDQRRRNARRAGGRPLRTVALVLAVGLVAAACGTVRNISETVSGIRDAVSDVRDVVGTIDPTGPAEELAPLEWADLPEQQRFCGATWTRDEMMAAYEERGLDGLPRPVGFNPTFTSEIDEFYQRWRISRVIEAARERRDAAGQERMRLITCIVGTRGREDPRVNVGVNVLHINDHDRMIDRPTLTGVEVALSIRDDEASGEATDGGREPDAELRWVGRCTRNVQMPPGTYTQTRCVLDGPGGLTSTFTDAPDGLPTEGCPDPALTCDGLAYTPSREVFTTILADPDIDYGFSWSATMAWHDPS